MKNLETPGKTGRVGRYACSTCLQPGVQMGTTKLSDRIALSFSLKVWSILVHFSGSNEPIILTWVLLKKCFPSAEVEYR